MGADGEGSGGPDCHLDGPVALRWADVYKVPNLG